MALIHKPVAKSNAPQSPNAWFVLAQLAVQRAEQSNDRRALGLKLAISKNQVEKVLRQMGIICENDILREFPTP